MFTWKNLRCLPRSWETLCTLKVHASSTLSQACSRTHQTALINFTPMSTRWRSCRCQVHADTAEINLNIWLTDDSANLGSVETDDGGGLTVFHAKPPGVKSDFVFTMMAKVIAIWLESVHKPRQPLEQGPVRGYRSVILATQLETHYYQAQQLVSHRVKAGWAVLRSRSRKGSTQKTRD